MRRMAAAMAVVVAAGMAGTCGYQRSAITAKAAEVSTEELEKVAENALSTEKETTDDGSAKKEESVYVKADPSGKVINTTVTEWLKNTGKGSLSDTTELEDVKNIKGEEAFTESGNELTWEAVGDDIYYQGTTEKELPVGVTITYRLDGKELSAEDLQGKDGKLEIHIHYTNTSKSVQEVNGKSEELFTPFTMITAMMLPADQYDNVEIDNGKVISDAERQIVVGLGFPGLNDNLKLTDSDLELPEEVTITADVKNATVEPSITVATTEFLQNLDADSIDSFDDLGDSMAQLKDATNQLVDGSKEAAEGAAELSEGASTLKSGTTELAGGVETLTGKVPELVTGVADLTAGVNNYTAGAAALKNGMETANPETGKSLMSGASELENGTALVAGGIQTLEQSLAQLKTAAGTVNTQAAAAAADAQTLMGMISGMTGSVTVGEGASITKNAEIDETELRTALEQAGFSGEELEAAVTAVKGLSATVQIEQKDLDGKVSATIDQKDEAVKQAQKTLQEIGTASGYAAAVDQGLQNMQEAISGTDTSVGLSSAASQTAAGAKGLNEGVKTVQASMGQLVSGGAALKAGTGALTEGVSILVEGASALDEGTDQLNQGAGALAEGASALAEGNAALAEGMAQYKAEAIDKLTELFDGDLLQITERLKAMTEAGKEYQSFAGIHSNMSGSTKFIIETEGIDD